VPLNSGFYRAVSVDLGPPGTVVNAEWPVAVTGFCSGPYEKIMNSIFELWSELVPERAIACSFNLEYLLVGGRDLRRRERPIFMWYDWMVGGWGGRNGKDGSTATAPIFGVGLAVQPLEGQERLCPVLTSSHEIVTDSGGPGQFRGGLGMVREYRLLGPARRTGRGGRELTPPRGVDGGMAGRPSRVVLNPGAPTERTLTGRDTNVELAPGDVLRMELGGAGGYGDPWTRSPSEVVRDVREGYVSPEAARTDYGVVVRPVGRAWEVDDPATGALRAGRDGGAGIDERAGKGAADAD
jgi:N-methylhydantoinase B